MKKRLFVAVDLGSSLSESFFTMLKKLKINADRKELQIRWVPTKNYHATLTFLGETEEDKIPDVAKCLQSVASRFAPLELKIEDVGAFSSEYEARALWMGVQNKRSLNNLKNELDQELLDSNLISRLEDRVFVPHMTFARLRNPKSVRDLLSPFKRKSFGKIPIKELVLYESKVFGSNPVYVPIFKVALQGSPELNFDTLSAEMVSSF
jgi:2'-5' RNA ligase